MPVERNPRRRKAVLAEREAIVVETRVNRGNRATALCLAAMSFRGEAFDMAGVMMLADEYLNYIEGDDSAPLPRPDLAGKRVVKK
jgi:hypothetical protein